MLITAQAMIYEPYHNTRKALPSRIGKMFMPRVIIRLIFNCIRKINDVIN